VSFPDDAAAIPFNTLSMVAGSHFNLHPRVGLVLAALAALAGCDAKLNVGEWCEQEASAPPDAGDGVVIPWSTGFEDRFCDYTLLAGYCYSDPHASFAIVTSPVHSGRYAAAFSVNASDLNALQSRCVRQGVLPTAAYYGAWYYVPALASAAGNWNLWFFQGGDAAGAPLHPLWNVTLVNRSNGDLGLIAYTPLNGKVYPATPATSIPVDTWFHIEFFLKRARDTTGEVALYQDGVLLFDITGLITDDSSFGQWYVGNLVGSLALTPPASTLYVDDISISATQ
jgi:hypothetical protein